MSASVRACVVERRVQPVELLVQIGDPLRGDEPGLHVEGRDRLDEVVVGAGFHACEHVFVLARATVGEDQYV